MEAEEGRKRIPEKGEEEYEEQVFADRQRKDRAEIRPDVEYVELESTAREFGVTSYP